MSRKYDDLFDMAKKRISSGGRKDEVLTALCHLLKEEVEHYDWVGIYTADSRKKELKLGPFAGELTEHIKIPFGKGICGQVAMNHRTFVSQDVASEPNYLSCSPWVKSEIVVPIMKNGKFVAQLDIDSHTKASIDEDDVLFLEALCKELAVLF
ncbi:MAG: GAF domain-containing protein [Candidatus Thermoplasmatota archaeon]|nr:GAF domain-containing protein [Euryarchaeota archaeon]MBU4032551.1 GAF domain-containing protein [Candidatus Thermoplasmatota archaeon]MBU4072024.1 GAF domain-containing protein [Candidatus Thermoplasmatota archaeon]MBU4144555.1 GAF domain-containing protein [Candidatus Thermoplasmatota archaeon]MBU4592104.1 GAF domain-containing protein [Candidatus Thermoplasmatota archaeon]